MLAQRLARRGWRIVIIEAGPFWHPDEDWVSDEAGSHQLYWTQERVIGGDDPIELGKNNSGRGVGGSMVHYAGYCPRFHPSDFETFTRDGVGADWPIDYSDLKPHYEELERELPVAGQDWPWGDPHRYPFSPHPIAAAAQMLWQGAVAQGIEMRVGPVGIVNGTFGNRPHCIYRGFCLQGCKVNAKASPYVTHLPDALAHGVEIRANSMAVRVEIDEASGRATGVTYVREGESMERRQRAKVVAVAGYSIETPRLLLHSTSKRFPNGVGNDEDQVGRYVMVQGATQTAGRFPDELRMYKGPPPEVSSEQFYETDPARGLRAGILDPDRVARSRSGGPNTCSPTGHWGRAMREYMRDYNHWTTVGVLNELLPHAENRVTWPTETDPYGMPVARFDYSRFGERQSEHGLLDRGHQGHPEAAGAQDVLTIQRYAHLVGGARMGTVPRTASSTPTTACGRSRTCSLPTAASAPPRARPIRR